MDEELVECDSFFEGDYDIVKRIRRNVLDNINRERILK